MQPSEIAPDVISMDAAISSCEKCSQWEQASRQLCELQGIRGNVLAFRHIFSATEALQLLWDMPGARLHANVISFNAALSACEKSSFWAKALQLFATMPAGAVEPDLISFNSCISACGSSSEWQMAVHFLSLMPVSRILGSCWICFNWPSWGSTVNSLIS